MAERAEKLTRKELKAPDEFQKIGAQAVPFLVLHQRNVVLGITGLVVVGGVVAMANYFGDRKEQAAKQDLGAALKTVEREVKAGDTTEPVPGQDAPYKSETEKVQAEIKALNDFRTNHAGTRAAANAGLALGDAYLKAGQGAEALAAFDDYLKNGDSTDPLRPAALEGKGYAYEAQKDYPKALDAFDQLARETKTDFMKGMGLYHRGRILLAQGKTDDGAKALVEVPSLAPNSAAARLAQERISTLAAQGVHIPAPPPVIAVPDAG
jgi:tetratricopeptide (TPR) repeat protein